MTQRVPVVSIIIVNYNGRALLAGCLNSLRDKVSVSHEIVVVDNASTDDSVPFVSAMYPCVRLIFSPVNLGFAAGNNLGARAAKGRFLLLLNNDTLMRTDIRAAVEFLEQHPLVGILGAKMLDEKGNYRYSAGYFPMPHRLFKFSSRSVKKGPFRDGNFPGVNDSTFYEVNYVEASFLLTRKVLWDKMGGLDENLFMYGEDSEFCYRMKQSGYTTVFFPSVEYVHFGGFSPSREHLLVNGIKYFHRKWSPRPIYGLVIAILHARLALRLGVYGLAFLMNRKKTNLEKVKSSLTALRL